MTSLSKRHATYEDILALPDNVVGELVAGDLLVSPRPSGPHAVASSNLGIEIGGPFAKGRGGPGGWWIIDEPELHLRADVLVPDLAGWLREELPRVPNDHRFTVAPRWICEVLSPSTARYDRIAKLDAYQAAGVAYAWIVDPLERTLEVFRNAGSAWLRVQAFAEAHGHASVRAEPFDAVAIDLAGLWVPSEP